MATGEVFYNPGTAYVFDSSGSNGAVITLNGPLTNGSGRVSAQLDRGSGAKVQQYRWEAEFKLQGTPTLGNPISIYIANAQADNTKPDGNVGVADAALSALDKRRNLQFIGIVEIDVAGTGMQKGSGVCELAARYISCVVINEGGTSFSVTAGDHAITFTPIPPQIQA